MQPSHRRRFVIGTAVGAAAAVWLSHGFVSDARKRIARDLQDRRAVVAAQAAASDPSRLSQWQAGTPGVEQARWIRGMQLEASTVAGEKAPRRLARDEKGLYDQAQRIASAVHTNQDEGARKEEIELDEAGGRLAVATPAAAGGIVQIVTRPLEPLPRTGWGAFLLAFLAAVVGAGAGALVLGERRRLLAVVSAAALVIPVVVLVESQAARVASERRAEADAVAQRVREQVALVPAASTATLDVDAFRGPRGEVQADGSVDAVKVSAAASLAAHQLRRALLSALAAGLLLLALTGFGVLSRLGSSLRRNRQAGPAT